jgi:hypothetical protein
MTHIHHCSIIRRRGSGGRRCRRSSSGQGLLLLLRFYFAAVDTGKYFPRLSKLSDVAEIRAGVTGDVLPSVAVATGNPVSAALQSATPICDYRRPGKYSNIRIRIF